MPDEDRDPESSPGTAAFVPDFDTGPQSEPLHTPHSDSGPTSEAETRSPSAEPDELADPEPGHAPGATPDESPAAEELPAPAHSVTVPGRYFYLRWWKLLLVVAAVWVVAAVIGAGLFSWWYQSLNKTPVLFFVLVYVVVCTVGGLMLAMVPGKPLLTALAIAVLSAVFASLAAAAPLYGHSFCERAKHCIVGVIPY